MTGEELLVYNVVDNILFDKDVLGGPAIVIFINDPI